MQLSESTNNTGLLEDLRWWTDTNATSYPTLDAYRNINKAYQELVAEALMSMDSWDFNGEIATGSLVANQQEYTWPTTLAKVKRVEVTYDGTEWHKVEPLDIQSITTPISNQTDINEQFSTSKPFYDLHDASLFLFPVPTTSVSSGIKIWYEKDVTELSNTTDVPLLPVQFHRLISMIAAWDYMLKKGLPAANALAQKVEIMRVKLREYMNTRTQDYKYIATPHLENYK